MTRRDKSPQGIRHRKRGRWATFNSLIGCPQTISQRAYGARGAGWQTSGTGSSHEWGHRLHNYAGTGAVSSVSSGGPGVQTSSSASVLETGSDHGTYDYTTKADYAGSGWNSSGSGTASALMSATFVYVSKAVTKTDYSSSGPHGSDRALGKSTVTHAVNQVGVTGSAEQYTLGSAAWILTSRGAGGGYTDQRSYDDVGSASASSVAYSGDYSGGNGTRYASWSSGTWNDFEVDDVGDGWTQETKYAPDGSVIGASGAASGSEDASGTANLSQTEGWQRNEVSNSPSESFSSMSTATSSDVAHDQYNDQASWSQRELADGQVNGGGSGSFQVSGHHNANFHEHWQWTLTTDGTASGSGSGSGGGGGSTESSEGGNQWSAASSYSASVDYWGFYVGAYVGGSVFFESGEGWTGPGSPDDTGSGGGLDTGGTVSEIIPGPPGGPLGSSTAGPTGDVGSNAPNRDLGIPTATVSSLDFQEGEAGSVEAAEEANGGTMTAPQMPPPVTGLEGLLAAENSKDSQVPNGMPLADGPSAQATLADAEGLLAYAGPKDKNGQKNPDKADPAKYGGQGIPYKVGQGPTSVVGIVGGFQSYKDETTATYELAKAIAEKTGAQKADRFKMYQYDGVGAANNKSIAEEQIEMMEAASENEEIKEGKPFSVILIGHSYGGDKAMQTAAELDGLLKKNEKLKALYEQGLIQIHLVTIDPMWIGRANVSANPPKGLKSKVSSWHNYYQQDDLKTENPGTIFNYPGKLQSMPYKLYGAADTNLTTPEIEDDKNKHFNLPRIAKPKVLDGLGLPAK